MARKTKEEAEATRDSILEAAAKVFVEQGVANASLAEIAAEANVTRGAVYWHFKNKTDIFAALHEQLFVSFWEMIFEGLEKDHPHPLEQLAAFCVELMVDLDRNPQKKRVLTIFFVKCDYCGEMEHFLNIQNKQKSESRELFARYFERAVAKGELPADADPVALTQALVCYITGIAFEYLRSPDLFDMQAQAESLIRVFFDGLIPRG